MTNNSLLHALSALGLHAHEALMYIFLAEHGASNVSAIANGVHLSRVTTYTYLEKLVADAYVLKTKIKERDLYEVCDPSSLVAKLDAVHKEGSFALIALAQSLKRTLYIPQVSMLHGKEGINNIFNDIAQSLPKGGTFFRYTSRTSDFDYTPLYMGLRKEKELERLVITSATKADKKRKDSDRFIKTVPKDFAFDDNVTLFIYGNKISYVDYNSQTGITVESPQLAHFQEKIFKLLWKRL